jgi:acyl-CoA thioester hydrolase
MKFKIYYHHTDCGGVVYYANYLEFLEEARTEFFVARGILIPELIRQGRFFVVARQEIDYKSPAFYADELDIQSEITEISGARLTFRATIKNQKVQLVAEAKTVLVFVDKNFKPTAIPEDIQACLTVKK